MSYIHNQKRRKESIMNERRRPIPSGNGSAENAPKGKPNSGKTKTADLRGRIKQRESARAELLNKHIHRREPLPEGKTRLFVLDTNVFLHDPTCFSRFDEHDIYLPIITLEELDNHKKGMSEVARNARETSRIIEEITHGSEIDIKDGFPLVEWSHGVATGKLFLQMEPIPQEEKATFPCSNNDNQILGVVQHLKKTRNEHSVILVSKDINMRIKARALDIPAEDYFNDKVLEDTDLLYAGVRELPEDFWDTHGKGMDSWKKDGRDHYRVNGPLVPSLSVNEFIWEENGNGKPFHAIISDIEGRAATLKTIRDYGHDKNAVWGITARNREQSFALNLLMEPEIDFVTLLGPAGTGKTLLTLAAGLTQVLEKKLYNEIIFTRVTVPVGEDIGFLPGTEEEKMTPWMGALEDNLDVLNHVAEDDGSGEWGRAATQDLIRSRIKIKSLNFMRGRTFINKFVVIDEAQNLTSKQMKTLITRAGPGTKMVCLGNIGQIDTPYLTEGSSGLTYVVDRFKGWLHNGHIILRQGERSRLADYANEHL